MDDKLINDKEVDSLYKKLYKEAEESGYHLNPDLQVTKGLIEGLIVNEKRYGYWACPCRLAIGDKDDDLDIICPCDYRDPDLNDYNTCFCALYVSQSVVDRKVKIRPIPERRYSDNNIKKEKERNINMNNIKYPIWRCRVCGYLCSREHPPEICPICRAKKERFEKFIFN